MNDTSVSEQENVNAPKIEASSEQIENDLVDSAKDVENGNDESKQEIQVFRSDEEASEYIRNYEIATNNKFLKRSNRKKESDVQSLHGYCIQYKFNLSLGQQKCNLSDGIPTVRLSTEERECQYGPDYGNSRHEKYIEPDKKRKVMGTSKKLGCKAHLRIRKVLKFPEYYLEESKRTKHIISGMLTKLRDNFSAETKRYTLVYVYIDTRHNHEPCPILRPPKYLSTNRKISQGCNRTVDEANEYENKGLVLKRPGSLKGKDLSYLALQFKDAHELPTLIARPRKRQILIDMDIHELMSLYHEITGQVPNEMFALASKPFTKDNMVLLLHLCIMFANAAVDKQTHRSVRLKGTECEFRPVECFEDSCGLDDLHMHCPLCSRADSYTDVNLLKAHYTKQHINRALEFTGMNILRCLDACQVNSKSLKNKTFKAGHWHCFACSNAFESRHDIIAHFKRHLSAFGSSFQVHIVQDINPLSPYKTTTYEIQNTMSGIIDMADSDFHGLDMSNYAMENNLCPSKYVSEVSPTKRPYTAEYADGASPTKRPYTETGQNGHDSSVVYVEVDELGNVVSTYSAQQIPTAEQDNVVISYADAPDVAQLKIRIRELEMKNRKLDRQSVLQKSYVDFLEKTNSDQKEEYCQEIEKLKTEIAELRKEQGLGNDASQSADSEANNSTTSRGASVGSAAIPRKCTSKKNLPVPEKATTENLENVADQLSNLQKEVQNLRSNLCTNLAVSTPLGTNPILPNPSSVCYIPNQGMMTPYIIPQNVTGLANTNLATAQNVPLNMFQNSAALNLLNYQQKLSNTLNASTLLPNTQTTNVSSKNNKQYSELAKETGEVKDQGQLDSNSSENKGVNAMESPDISKAPVFNEEVVSSETPEVSMDGDTSSIQTDNDKGMEPAKEKTTATESEKVSDKTVSINPKHKLDGTCVENYDNFIEDAPESGTGSEGESQQVVDETASEICQDTPGGSFNQSNEITDNEDIKYAAPLRSDQSSVTNDVVTNSLKTVLTEKSSTVTESIATTISSSSVVTCTSSLSSTVNTNSTTTSSTGDLISSNLPLMFSSVGPYPVLMVPNQNYASPFMGTPNIPGLLNPMGLTAPNVASISNEQNTNDQFVVVNSPNGSFLVPKSKISGLDKIPGMHESATANTKSLNAQKKESITSEVQNSQTTDTYSFIKTSKESVSKRKPAAARRGYVGTSNFVIVDHRKKEGKLDDITPSSSNEINAIVTSPDNKCTDTTNIKQSNGVYVSTPTPQKSTDNKSATKRVHEESTGKQVQTNQSSSRLRDILSAQRIPDNGVSDTDGGTPAKKNNIVFVKVSKYEDKSVLSEIIKRNKIFLKNTDKSKKND